VKAARVASLLAAAAASAWPRRARADNCSGLSDCSAGVKVALVVGAIVLILALWQLAPLLAAQAALASSRAALMAALRAAGVKFTEAAVVGITRTAAGRLVWLEVGSAAAGLQHIVQRHGAQFAAYGARSASQIANVVMNAVRSAQPVMTYPGGAADYAIRIGDKMRIIRVVIGDNGFIVTAHPVGF
jgi:hypothetical protein